MHTLISACFAALLLAIPAHAATVTLNPTADAYVQNGSNANKNYGTNSQLRAQTNSTAANNYDSYLRFDTAAAAGPITSARLRLYASLSKSGSVATSAHAVADTAWGETSVTWNNKPALGAVLGSMSTTTTSYTWKEVDVTAYVQSERAAGRNVISLGLHNGATSSVYVRANSRNASSNQPQLVIVTNAAPNVGITSPTGGSSYTAPANLTLSATATDSDGSIAKVEFYSGATLIGPGTLSGSSYTLPWSNVAAGSYTLTAKATDNLGAVTTSSPVSIAVNPPANVPPTVGLTTPASGSTYTAPASVDLAASASDSDGAITKVEFYSGTTLLGTATSAPYAYTWSNVPAGSYSLTAQATDNSGAVTTSAPATITVSAVMAHGVYYVYADQVNAPRVITDSTNKVVWRWDSDPFGSDAANEDPDGDGARFAYNLRFPGQYFDQETGLHYNYFRDYDPSTGRYVQSDPIGLEGGSFSTFTYASNIPTSQIDPSGLANGPAVKWMNINGSWTNKIPPSWQSFPDDFIVHGFWCGPGWTGGQRGAYSPANGNKYKPPIDNLDSACITHDICYASCRAKYPCDPDARSQCFEQCDKTLASQTGVGFDDLQIWLTMSRLTKRDPGPNRDYCQCTTSKK